VWLLLGPIITGPIMSRMDIWGWPAGFCQRGARGRQTRRNSGGDPPPDPWNSGRYVLLARTGASGVRRSRTTKVR
jgi:hypothetical protein